MEDEISRDVNDKTFILSGDTFIDIKAVASFRFKKDKKGYLLCIYKMLTDSGYEVCTRIENRNELSQLFMQLEYFFDDPTLTNQLMSIINKIELKYNHK